MRNHSLLLLLTCGTVYQTTSVHVTIYNIKPPFFLEKAIMSTFICLLFNSLFICLKSEIFTYCLECSVKRLAEGWKGAIQILMIIISQ